MTTRIRAVSLLATSAVLALAVAGCGSDAKDDQPKAAGACSYPDDSLGKPAKKVSKPPTTPTETGDVKVVVGTNQGDIPLVLDGKNAPCAVNSFLSLAKQKYYDDSTCSRVLGDSRGVGILQCGDPTGTGTGGPGYTFKEEVTGNEKYALGVVAMAKRQDPATTGGQFFMMFADSSQAFPPEYTILGRVSDKAGLAVLEKAGSVAMQGEPDGYDGKPASPIVVTGVTLS